MAKKSLVWLLEKIKYIVIAFLLAVFSWFMLFGSAIYVNTADDYSILDDLKKDSTFNIEDYPNVSEDYNLYLIQICETSNKELILYVYNPSHYNIDLVAKKVSISYGFSYNGNDLNPSIYDLELLGTESVFDKYLVKVFEIPDEAYRYYNIVSLYREFNESIDESSEYTKLTYISCGIGQQWCCYYYNDSLIYEMNTFNSVDVKSNLIGELAFNSGLKFKNFFGSFDKGIFFYVAFDIENFDVKYLYDADISYDLMYYEESWIPFVGTDIDEYNKGNIKSYLSSEDEISYKGNGLLAREYSWNKILSSEEFLNALIDDKTSVDDEYLNIIKDSDYVFTFAVTESTFTSYDSGSYKTYYSCDNIGILRLHFLDVNNKIFNLGVVSNLGNSIGITGNSDSIFEDIKDFLKDIWELIQKVFLFVGIILIVVVLSFIINLLIPGFNLIKFIIKSIVFIFSLPIKFIKWIFKK